MDTAPAATPDESTIPLTNADLDTIAEPSRPFIGNWHAVVSQTNWEKGQIISEWRQKLVDAGVAGRLYSDPAWSRLVGEVSPQHVGRLRRTWDRFGSVHGDYSGLYWSHFFAALDWDDAEMWLEGAVQNNWSVSKMRFQRWETLGAVEGQRPDPLDLISGPDEEGVRIPATGQSEAEIVQRDELPAAAAGPLHEGPDFGDEDPGSGTPAPAESRGDRALSGSQVDMEEILAEVPRDISQPFVQLRDAIAHHRDQDWEDVKRIHVVALVNDLRQLLRKPPADEA